ncbi:Imm50 family immunity protein [Sporomusa malonica]|uniref:Immunity protein 50 n=1 Tax=Sporomusa malonica TaxID=112901 RepID=A0A1W2F813_9FIRM|nr:Imm50 family immunity protein [Sporomusa malonica]SMD18033.1 Immunity protein 50 [Sporomusa malonica]
MWHESLEKSTFITNLYTEVPQLVDVRISQIKIHDEGDRVSLIFDMPYFADKPPKKWVALGHNTVIVHLDFFGIKEIMITSNNNKYRGSIDLINDIDGTVLIKVTGTIEARIKAGVGMIQSIEGYCNQV